MAVSILRTQTILNISAPTRPRMLTPAPTYTGPQLLCDPDVPGEREQRLRVYPNGHRRRTVRDAQRTTPILCNGRSGTHILSLPPELFHWIMDIVAETDAWDVISVAFVCHRWYDDLSANVWGHICLTIGCRPLPAERLRLQLQRSADRPLRVELSMEKRLAQTYTAILDFLALLAQPESLKRLRTLAIRSEYTLEPLTSDIAFLFFPPFPTSAESHPLPILERLEFNSAASDLRLTLLSARTLSTAPELKHILTTNMEAFIRVGALPLQRLATCRASWLYNFFSNYQEVHLQQCAFLASATNLVEVYLSAERGYEHLRGPLVGAELTLPRLRRLTTDRGTTRILRRLVTPRLELLEVEIGDVEPKDAFLRFLTRNGDTLAGSLNVLRVRNFRKVACLLDPALLRLAALEELVLLTNVWLTRTEATALFTALTLPSPDAAQPGPAVFPRLRRLVYGDAHCGPYNDADAEDSEFGHLLTLPGKKEFLDGCRSIRSKEGWKLRMEHHDMRGKAEQERASSNRVRKAFKEMVRSRWWVDTSEGFEVVMSETAPSLAGIFSEGLAQLKAAAARARARRLRLGFAPMARKRWWRS
ncbi:hypothetical protein MKEN_01173200 [Mycena kentingensis (nom. inval.)]|nr:hypothetical protein MKEN_01173200 [Mycena kentingensis (nom. inval.)]